MLPCLPKRLVVARHRIDFRKQFNGLLAECYRMGFDPYAGDCVVFIKKDRTQLRVFFGDALGLFCIARRFDADRLRWLFEAHPASQSVTSTEVAMLLEGTSYTVDRRLKPWKKELS
jgi:hypothetical protein